MDTVPFNQPMILPASYAYLRQAVANMHLSGDGPFTKRCHALLERLLGVPKVLLTTSCTHALEMSALLLDIREGDEVIVPAFTFVSTINAFVLRGAKPVFLDIRPDTLNMDENLLSAAISSRTRAIVPVHYGGIGCEMDVIGELAAKHGVAVVEDNAHGLFGRYRGKLLGTFGAFATQSFHETKNFSCGEGGALLINNQTFIDRAEIIREKGTNRNRFFRGMVDKYTWLDIGSSFLPSDALAALLYAQLEQHEAIQKRRQRIWHGYSSALAGWAEDNDVVLPHVPEHCEPAYHLFHIVLPSLEQRTAFLAHLKQRGVSAVFHYLPLHLSEMGQRFGGHKGDCPVTESVSDRLVRLPFYNDLTPELQQRVIDAVCEFKVEKHESSLARHAA